MNTKNSGSGESLHYERNKVCLVQLKANTQFFLNDSKFAIAIVCDEIRLSDALLHRYVLDIIERCTQNSREVILQPPLYSSLQFINHYFGLSRFKEASRSNLSECTLLPYDLVLL